MRQYHLSWLRHLSWLLAASSVSLEPGTKPLCKEKCGSITVPYPFGMDNPHCYHDEGFQIFCNETNKPPKAMLGTKSGYVEVLELTSAGKAEINGFVVWKCSPNEGRRVSNSYDNLKMMDLEETPYTISAIDNRFVAVGCNILAYAEEKKDGKGFLTTACMTNCNKTDDIPREYCSLIGCCHNSIPGDLKKFDVHFLEWGGVRSQDGKHGYDPCRYAFLIKNNQSDESVPVIPDFYRRRSTVAVPVVLDWAIRNTTCGGGGGGGAPFTCGENALCSNSTNGDGYLCNCEEGYEGNPYLGCQDIDECEDPRLHNCTRICKNMDGSHSCHCPSGMHGDGRRDGIGCIKVNKEILALEIAIGVGSVLFLLLVASSWLYLGLKKRRLIKLKEKFFEQNGGLLLQQICSGKGASAMTKIFSTEELKKATDSYNESRILGQGGQGTVYKGILPDCKVVAIKKSKLVDESQIDQFINEVSILSQINHRNVVKLLGCCLETEVPLLVYEFVSNGTLFHHIHDETHISSISWENRLRIAAETASALAYLHSAASIPIFHRDVKSTNILLDDNYTAKVSDFGASRSVPFDQTHVTTLVQGTLGYLDPEYFYSSQLTDKSDVYSFGVVLVELLTGEKPICFSRSLGDRNLATHFISAVDDNRLFDIIEARVADEGEKEQLQEFSELAKRCLRLNGEERPTMKEVAAVLEDLRRLQKHPLFEQIHEEIEVLLDEPR